MCGIPKHVVGFGGFYITEWSGQAGSTLKPGEVRGVFSEATDITAQKQADAQVRGQAPSSAALTVSRTAEDMARRGQIPARKVGVSWLFHGPTVFEKIFPQLKK